MLLFLAFRHAHFSFFAWNRRKFFPCLYNARVIGTLRYIFFRLLVANTYSIDIDELEEPKNDEFVSKCEICLFKILFYYYHYYFGVFLPADFCMLHKHKPEKNSDADDSTEMIFVNPNLSETIAVMMETRQGENQNSVCRFENSTNWKESNNKIYKCKEVHHFRSVHNCTHGDSSFSHEEHKKKKLVWHFVCEFFALAYEIFARFSSFYCSGILV